MHSLIRVLYKSTAVSATIGILVVLLAGAVVTHTGSGDGCGPNWPLCHGKLIPPEFKLETIIEYTHRLLTLIAGILIGVFTVWSIIRYRKCKEVIVVAALAIFFLVLQSVLGAIAVVNDQSSLVMALHFGFSLLSYATVFMLMLYAFQIEKHGALPKSEYVSRLKTFRPTVIGLFVYTYFVVYLGAYVRHTGSGLACEGWPLCNGQIIPNMDGGVGIQFAHRVAALILFLLFTLFLVYILKYFRADKILRRYFSAMFVLITLQVLSGGIVVLTEMNAYASLSHAFFISLLFGFLCYVSFYVFRRSVHAPASSKKAVDY